MNPLFKLMYSILCRVRGEVTTWELQKRGMKIGKNFIRLNRVMIDPTHCWLLEIGDDVTLAPRVHILCHDASTKQYIGYAKIGRVTIGNKVFIGAGTTILPGVKIGSNVIVGANSVITHNIPDNSVAVGNPARVISTVDEYITKEKARMEHSHCYGWDYTYGGKITDEKKKQQKDELENEIGYVV